MPTRRQTSKPTHHDIDCTHPLTAKQSKLRITVTPDYLIQGTTHLEIRSTAPRDAPHPLSSTGYLSHFIDSAELAAAGGPIAFVNAWIKRELTSAKFLREDLKRRQGGLFEWADAREVTTMAPGRRPRQPAKTKPTAKPAQRRPR